MKKTSKKKSKLSSEKLNKSDTQAKVQAVFDYWDERAMSSAKPLSITSNKKKTKKPKPETAKGKKNER